MAAERKIPLRQCVGCGEDKEKKAMLRVIKTSEGEILLDDTGKKNGRGAYICRNSECFASARKNRRFERSLSCKIEDSVYEVMENELAAEDN